MKVKVFVVGVIVFLLSVVIISAVEAQDKPTIEVVSFEYYEVKEGDTLWTLAKSRKGDMDTRYYVDLVREANKLYTDKILVGENIILPNYH